ncbi:uncharacterized protein LOC106655770 [Trichogramma pretiosum]|uniref:uncharacterized protein LOC106655770 n=1 Tax=Trichogramma pretiosum TaxID=7493 RepID=UPI0006C9A0B2|nr:uncharacterized protein LOC106655770 [Trichogramma pretiosum]
MVRFKNRYIIVKITEKTKLDQKRPIAWKIKNGAIHDAINKKCSQMYGDLGSASIKAGFTAKYFNAFTRIAFVRSRHGPHEFILKVLPKITEISGKEVHVKILYIGGTLKHCFMYVKNYQEKKMEEIYSDAKTESQKSELEEALMYTMMPSWQDFFNSKAAT